MCWRRITKEAFTSLPRPASWGRAWRLDAAWVGQRQPESARSRAVNRASRRRQVGATTGPSMADARSTGAGGLSPSLQKPQAVSDLERPIANLASPLVDADQLGWLAELRQWNAEFRRRHPRVAELDVRTDSLTSRTACKPRRRKRSTLRKRLLTRRCESCTGLDPQPTRIPEPSCFCGGWSNGAYGLSSFPA